MPRTDGSYVAPELLQQFSQEAAENVGRAARRASERVRHAPDPELERKVIEACAEAKSRRKPGF